jgi:hypothetical protein
MQIPWVSYITFLALEFISIKIAQSTQNSTFGHSYSPLKHNVMVYE